MGSPVVHWQIVSNDAEAASKFYRKLFDWKVSTANALGYRVVETLNPKGIAGGIWPAPPNAQGLVQLFIEVQDVEAYVREASELGAKVLVPTSTLPDGDTMAVLLDPTGIPFGLVQTQSRT